MSFGKRPEFELYRLSDDPECVRNLAADANFAQTATGLRTRLDAMLREEQDPRALGSAAIFDTYQYLGNRRNKGYDEWLKARQAKGKDSPE